MRFFLVPLCLLVGLFAGVKVFGSPHELAGVPFLAVAVVGLVFLLVKRGPLK